MAEINLWLDSYNDIYSDFDSRHYLKRRISEDLLFELRTEMKYKEQHTGDMILLLPADQRNNASEKIIAESLVAFFSRQFHFYRSKCRKKMNKGILLFISGFMLMLFNSWLSLSTGKSFPLIALKVLLEPAGWFMVWLAFDLLFYDLTELKKEREFYKALTEMHVHFRSS